MGIIDSENVESYSIEEQRLYWISVAIYLKMQAEQALTKAYELAQKSS